LSCACDEFTDVERIPAGVSVRPAHGGKSAVSAYSTIIPRPGFGARGAGYPLGGSGTSATRCRGLIEGCLEVGPELVTVDRRRECERRENGRLRDERTPPQRP